VLFDFLFSWYQTQRLRVNCNAVPSISCFLRSLMTGGCNFSHSVHPVYRWFALWTWTVWGWLCLGWPVLGALTYDDDLTLLSPSPAAIRRLLYICEQFGATNNVIQTTPNASNFHVLVLMVLVVFFFCGKSILCAKSVLHLGHVLTCNLMDNADILRCSRDFCKQANGILLGLVFVILLYRLDCSLVTYVPVWLCFGVS